ncbi:MAG: gfo/Idh/MocA family oxidoreductase, partial [Verrucomicrobiota bacterium]
TKGAGFGLQIIGSEGVLNVQCDKDPLVHLRRGNPFDPQQSEAWIPVTSGGVGKPEEADIEERIHQHGDVVRDLIRCLGTDRKPLCHEGSGTRTVEMVCAVFESHRRGGSEVSLPLAFRGNALSEL